MDDKPVRQDGTIAELQDGKAPERASAEIKAIIEALIFASPEPLTPKAIFKLLATEPREDIQAALALLKQEYERPGGLQLVEVAGGSVLVVEGAAALTVRQGAERPLVDRVVEAPVADVAGEHGSFLAGRDGEG